MEAADRSDMTDFVPEPENALELTDPLDIKRLEARLRGTYRSGWSTLKNGAASSLRSAALQTQELLSNLGNIEKKNEPGAAAFITSLNYDLAILGPSLGTVLLAAAALESYLRLGLQVAMELSRPRNGRRGFSRTLLARLGEFDRANPEEKVRQLVSALRAGSIDGIDTAIGETRALFRYRNDCMHDAPTLIASLTRELKAQDRRAPHKDAGLDICGYPRLANNLRPVRLIHAMRAICAHDMVVGAIDGHTRGSKWNDAVRSIDAASRGFHTIAEMFSKSPPWSAIEEVAAAWEAEGERVATSSLADSAAFLQDLNRRQNVKRVK